MDSNENILTYARHLYRRRGDNAFELAREMVAHLQSIRDLDRASDWRRIIAAMETLRDGTPIGGCRATDQVPEAYRTAISTAAKPATSAAATIISVPYLDQNGMAEPRQDRRTHWREWARGVVTRTRARGSACFVAETRSL